MKIIWLDKFMVNILKTDIDVNYDADTLNLRDLQVLGNDFATKHQIQKKVSQQHHMT